MVETSITRVGEMQTEILVGHSNGNTRQRWEDNGLLKWVLRQYGGYGKIRMAQDGGRWRALNNTITLWFYKRRGI